MGRGDRRRLAVLQAGLGHKEQAFESLERAFEQHSLLLGRLKMDPQLDPLRSDPRFAEFVRRLGLQP